MAAPTLRAESNVSSLPETSVKKYVYKPGAKPQAGDCLVLFIARYETQLALTGTAGWTSVGSVSLENRSGGEKWRGDLLVLPNWNGTTTEYEFTWEVASPFLLINSWAVAGAHHTTPVSGSVFTQNGLTPASGTMPIAEYAGGTTEGLTFLLAANTFGNGYGAITGYTSKNSEIDHAMWMRSTGSSGSVPATGVPNEFGTENKKNALGISLTFQPVATGEAPVVTSEAAGSIGEAGATLNGTVNPKSQSTKYWWEYGTTEAFGTKTTEEEAGEGSSGVAKSKVLTGLTPGTKYFFRMAAKNATGTTNGSTLNFTTSAEIGGNTITKIYNGSVWKVVASKVLK